MRTSSSETRTDPSIAELGEQLDAFVASIQARLRDVADMDMPCVARKRSASANASSDPLDQLTAVDQRISEPMEYCNGT